MQELTEHHVRASTELTSVVGRPRPVGNAVGENHVIFCLEGSLVAFGDRTETITDPASLFAQAEALTVFRT